MATERKKLLDAAYKELKEKLLNPNPEIGDVRSSFIISHEIKTVRQGLSDEEIPKSEKLQELVAELRLANLIEAIFAADHHNEVEAACAVRTDHIMA